MENANVANLILVLFPLKAKWVELDNFHRRTKLVWFPLSKNNHGFIGGSRLEVVPLDQGRRSTRAAQWRWLEATVGTVERAGEA